MAAKTLDPTLSLQLRSQESQHGVVVEEIDGLIRVYKDGHVERLQIMPCVAPSLPPELGVTCRDMIIDKYTNVWARAYVPNATQRKLPLLVYFHGGGFCVGSAAWSCYHEFLAKLASRSNSIIVSVNYRLAPENPLPAAFDDGVKALVWLSQQEFVGSSAWWANKCNFSRVYLGGDSAGANVAFNVAFKRQNGPSSSDTNLKGLILIQPFFGGETRTHSEKYTAQSPRSALTLAASDAYWRMSLPAGADRDHPWSKPPAEAKLQHMRVMVCASEMDILKDRNVEFCGSLASAGQRVERVVFNGVGHAFQILNNSPLSQTRTYELISRINDFIAWA